MMKKHSILLAFVGALLLLVACGSKNNTWQINGTVSNAPEGSKLAVERLQGFGWVLIDSVEIDADGNFAFNAPEGLPFHDIYRVSYGGKSVYFPIDSLDCVTLKADASTFDTGYKLSGTPLAEKMMDIDNMVNTALRDHGADYVLTDQDFRHSLGQAIVEDTTGIVAYYFINRSVGNRPLFDVSNPFDLRIIGAVANRFKTLRPADQRTATLEAIYSQSRRNNGAMTGQSMEAAQVGFIDLKFRNEKGADVSLSDVVAASDVTILNFTAYNGNEVSVLMNNELSRVIGQLAPRKVGVYQVSIDDNEPEWSKVAANLPWTTVWAGSGDAVSALGNYNLINAPLPMTFVIDGNGDLVQRISTEDLAADEKALENAVRNGLK